MNKINGDVFVNMLVSASNHLENRKELINRLNVFPVPDGDTGTNMSMTFSKAVREVAAADSLTVGEIGEKIASASLRGARGNSGVILSQFIRGLSKGFAGITETDSNNFSEALSAGAKSAYQAVMKPTEGTILTVMRALAEKAAEIGAETEDTLEFLEQVTAYGNEILKQTPEMLPKLKEANVVDAGGMGLIVIFEGMIYYLKNQEILPLADKNEQAEAEPSAAGQYIEDITFGYCTEYIIIKERIGAELLRTKLSKIGDSVVVVEDEDIIKVHVHTDNPDLALGLGLQLGQLIHLKIDNMRHQNEELKKATEEKKQEERKKYGFVAVASGEGFIKIYQDLGISGIIRGGQSMNPSTDDILEQVNAVNAETVFVFPNNKNIILAAEQARNLFEGNLVVIPTTSMAHVFSLMMAYDESMNKKELTKAFLNVLSHVTTGQVTYAVRNSKVGDIEIKENQIMELVEDKIIGVSEQVTASVMAVLQKMVTPDTEVVTIYSGQDITEEALANLAAQVEEAFPECDVSVFQGGQPIYYYILSAE